MSGRHLPVMLAEAVDALRVRPGGVYVDGTLGRGGHAMEIVRRGGRVIGIDRDDEALRDVEAMGVDGIRAVKGNHGDVAGLLDRLGVESVDGILLDLGVSSPQLDDPSRGFSFRADGPLDMRMDRSCGTTAADFVNSAGRDDLERTFRELGEEQGARRIANAIVRERDARRIETTLQLAEVVERAVGRHGARHPATKVFQALRMAMNGELAELSRALDGGFPRLGKGGRFAVITFESLSDRIVKRFFSEHAGRMVSLQQGGERWEGRLPQVRLVTPRALVPSEAEVEANPRSRSAKLRVAEAV